MPNNEDLQQIEVRLRDNLQKREAILRLRGLCLRYAKDNPAITVGEALALDRKTRPWLYPRTN